MDITELVVVGFIVFFLLFGPDKMKDIARALAEAQREYRKASIELQKAGLDLQKTSSQIVSPLKQASSQIVSPLKQASSEMLAPLKQASSEMLAPLKQASPEIVAPIKGASSQIVTPIPPMQTEEGLIRDTAKKLGINTEGKTKEQLAEEIVRKAGEIGRQLPPKEGEVKPEAAN